jgi:hypothetical protein
MRWLLVALIGLAAWVGASDVAVAQGTEQDRVMDTAYVTTRYGMSTHKSLLLESNDTAGTIRYGLGVWAGLDRSAGVEWTSETTAVSFALVEGTLAQTWEDLVFRYRYGSLYAGVIFGNLLMTSELAGATIFDARGSGYGGNVGLLMPLSKGTTFYIDVRSVSIAAAMEQTEQTFAVSGRTDMDIGATIDLTKRFLDFVFGYRYRTYSIATGSSYAELHTMTYLGLNFGSEF